MILRAVLDWEAVAMGEREEAKPFTEVAQSAAAIARVRNSMSILFWGGRMSSICIESVTDCDVCKILWALKNQDRHVKKNENSVTGDSSLCRLRSIDGEYLGSVPYVSVGRAGASRYKVGTTNSVQLYKPVQTLLHREVNSSLWCVQCCGSNTNEI